MKKNNKSKGFVLGLLLVLLCLFPTLMTQASSKVGISFTERTTSENTTEKPATTEATSQTVIPPTATATSETKTQNSALQETAETTTSQNLGESGNSGALKEQQLFSAILPKTAEKRSLLGLLGAFIVILVMGFFYLYRKPKRSKR